ncbi:Crp/Fnr family transcriptional regulator [Pedobacter sp. GR22-6]|uniref:Crp/Fnr family transcriptional regulator n=1 Tax=Pedobacter sp. GR22-6 TaxID=3127957 RepID=UPI00307DEDDE
MERYYPLTLAFKTALKAVLYEVEYVHGKRILNAMQTQRWVWFLIEGLIREIYVDSESLTEHTNWFWFPNSCVYTDPGLFSQEPSESAIEIVEDCRLVCISYRDWVGLRSNFSEVDYLTEKIRSSYSRIKYHHVLEKSYLTTEARYLKHEMALQHLFARAMLKHVAEYMGMAPDTLGKLRKKFSGR